LLFISTGIYNAPLFAWWPVPQYQSLWILDR
jgi:hypothetical protein